MKYLNDNIPIWWDKLQDKERMVLIELLYYLNSEDLREFGVVIKDDVYMRLKEKGV